MSLQTNRKLPVWRKRVVILSLLLFIFAIPHTLEDFALGEPAENGVPAEALALVVAGLFALQGLALFWTGQAERRSYFIHAGLGILWPLAAGVAQLAGYSSLWQLPFWIYFGLVRGRDDRHWPSALSGFFAGIESRRAGEERSHA